MPFGRIYRNVFLLGKIETTSGTDSVPTGGANAILPAGGDVKITPIEASQVPRNVVRGYFGSSGSFVGSTWMKAEFSVEKQGSGAAGTAPPWGVFLRAAGFAETVTAATRVDYTPVSSSIETMSLYAYTDGLQFKFIGGVVDFGGSTLVNNVPSYKITVYAPFLAPTAVSNPTPTLTAWKDPALVNDANTSDLVLGGTYAAGAISGEPQAVLAELKDRLLYRQAIETARCMAEGVLSSTHDANIGSIFAIGFPAWTGGAMQFIYSEGVERFTQRSAELAARYGAGFALSDTVKAVIDKHRP